jgi:hypothetical protein
MEQIIPVLLGAKDKDGTELRIAVRAEQNGPQLVSTKDVVARFSELTGAIEVVSREVLEAVKAAAPDKAVLELGFGVTVEAGKLVALISKLGGEATIKVTLEWSKG